MSSKEISSPYQNFTDGAMSATNSITSVVTNILYRDSVAIELSWTGTPTGAFFIEGSNSYNPGTPQSGGKFNAGVWTTIPAVDQTGNPPIASGAAGQILCNLFQLGFAYIRVTYTNSSGTGVLQGWIAAKSLG